MLSAIVIDHSRDPESERVDLVPDRDRECKECAGETEGERVRERDRGERERLLVPDRVGLYFGDERDLRGVCERECERLDGLAVFASLTLM